MPPIPPFTFEPEKSIERTLQVHFAKMTVPPIGLSCMIYLPTFNLYHKNQLEMQVNIHKYTIHGTHGP